MEQRLRQILMAMLMVAALVAPARLANADIQEESKKVATAVKEYVAAFNAGDVDKLVSLWSPDGVYISRTSGERLTGHEALKKEFASVLKAENRPKLAVATESISFISPNVALERGVATVSRSEAEAVYTKYSAVYTRRDGKWLLDRVTEDDLAQTVSNYDRLKDLEWLIGDWVDSGGNTTLELNASWTKNANFISRRFTISNRAADIESTGLQIIGWDASEQKIRSWLFDSDGGVVTGTWTKGDDGGWSVQSVATLADGGKGSFTSVYKPQEDGAVRWRKINRVVNGHLLPNLDEVVIRRK